MFMQWSSDVCVTFAIQSDLVYDISDRDCWAQKWQHSWSYFRDFQASSFNKHDEKFSEKPYFVYFVVVVVLPVKRLQSSC